MRSSRKLLCCGTNVHCLWLQRGLWQRPPCAIYIQESLLEFTSGHSLTLAPISRRKPYLAKFLSSVTKERKYLLLESAQNQSSHPLLHSSTSQGLHRSMSKGACSHLHTQLVLYQGCFSDIRENAAQRKTFPKTWAYTFAEATVLWRPGTLEGEQKHPVTSVTAKFHSETDFV